MRNEFMRNSVSLLRDQAASGPLHIALTKVQIMEAKRKLAYWEQCLVDGKLQQKQILAALNAKLKFGKKIKAAKRKAGINTLQKVAKKLKKKK